MNLVDLFLVLIVIFSIYSGYQRGFVIGILQLLMLAAGLLAAFLLYPYLAAFLEKNWSALGIWTVPLSFIFALLIARIILSLIVESMLKTVPQTAHTSTANKVMGVIPGAVNGILWAIIIAAIMLSIPFAEGLSKQAKDSVLADRMADKIEWLNDKFSPVFDNAVNKTMNKMTVEPGSEKSIKLPFTDDNPEAREDLEAKMLVLVNEERQKEGLKPLAADPEVQAVARAHSRDMFARGYFSHITPEGKSPFDRMKSKKVRFLTAGENLALGQTLNICHRGLMNSPGHRANILQPAFGRVGIGILDGGIRGLMITQNFRN
ncbi:MAG TPA: CvpA family protein [Segetibacter sp.]